MRLLLRAILALLLLLVVASGGLVWRLEQGPISLTAVQPLIQRLVDRSSPYRVSFTEPMLVWLREENAVGLAARDIELRNRADEFVAGAPAAHAVIALEPLIQGRVEPVQLGLDLPQLELTRELDGRLVLSFAGQLASLPLGEGREEKGFAALVVPGAATPDPTLARLREVQVSAPALVYVDTATGQSITADDAAFELEQENGAWEAALSARLGQGRIRIEGRPSPGGPLDSVKIGLEEFPLQALQALVPHLPKLQLDVPVSGTIAFTVDRGSLTPGAAHVTLTTSAASVASRALGLSETVLNRAVLEARLQPGWRQGQLDRLLLEGPGLALQITGRMSRIEDEITAELTMTARDFDVAEVLALWPERVAKAARAWIAGHVVAGQVQGGTFHLGRTTPRPSQADMGGGFTFSGVELRYLDTFPPATGVAGSASFAGDLLALTLREGRSAGVEATRGKATIGNILNEAPSQLAVDLDLRSSVPAAMTLLNAEPIALGRVSGLAPAKASGQQTTALRVNLPLVADLPRERIRFNATTRLTGLKLEGIRPGYDLEAASLRLTTDQSGLDMAGEVEVNGVPATAAWRENFVPVRGVKRSVDVTTSLSAVSVRALRLDWPAPLSGSFGATAKLVETRNAQRTVDLALDLRDLVISLPELLIMKRPGQAGSAVARLVQRNPATLAVERLSVDAGSLQAEGSMGLRLDPLRPERLSFTRLSTALGELTADLRLDRGAWRGRIDADRIDLRPTRRTEGGAGGGSPAIPDMAIDLTARSLRLGDAPLTGLTAWVERRGGIWQSARLRANVEDSEVALDLQTRQSSALTVRSNDAGWLIRALSTSDNGVRGGSFRLSADFRQQPDGPVGSGELKIRDFRLWGAPLVARIVSLASFSGLASALNGQGVPVQRLVVPFTIDRSLLRLEQARLVAADIGARADGTVDLGRGTIAVNGTVAPAYTVNRILGRIPIIGRILSGSGSDAALAATFSVSNTLADPVVTVNPLAVLVPGMVRDLFSALTADVGSDLNPTDQR